MAPKSGKASGALSAGIKVDGLDGLLRALRDLPKEAEHEVEAAALATSKILVGKVQSAGRREGSAAALVAGTVKVRKGTHPGVVVGGHGAVGQHGATADDLLYGSEFGHGGQGGRGKGSRDYAPHGFKPRAAPDGLWIFPTLKHEKSSAAREFHKAAEEIVDRFILDAGSWE